MDFAFVVSEKIEAGLDLVFNDLSVCFLVMFFYKIAKKTHRFICFAAYVGFFTR